MKVGILNVTGYAGIELARLLANHPQAKLTSVTGRSAAGQRLGDYLPHLANFDLAITEELGDVDFVFSGLGHKDSAERCLPYIRKGVPLVDLSADFRIKDAAEYKQWYKVDHPDASTLKSAVYGLTELHRDELRKTKLVANPGCYPTGAVLALAPAVKHGIITSDIIVDSKSGVSGAGRTLSLTVHFAEVDENVSAYALEGHRHFPEILHELERLNPSLKPKVTFVPHLIPMTRGILSTCYAPLNGKVGSGKTGKGDLLELYRDFYRNDPFVRVVSVPPQTKQTTGSNYCHVYPTIDERTNRLVAISAIDNLVKGASGEAIQNMNVMMGWPETMGLTTPGMYP
ncbi:MAG: N-acetyl-gamma-glutamyl-phosphate reductase [Chloroflexi bacterium]|nr:N-acetyl-gamma-glutamyl-phosphate reductase [Chloroflexota bacterium]